MQVLISETDEIDQPVEAQGGDGVIGLGADDWFGAVSNAHVGERHHWQIVGSVAYSYCFLERDVLALGDLPEHCGFARAVHDGRDDTPCDFAIDDFELVGVEFVDAEAGLQGFGEEGEATGKDGGVITEGFERAE